MKDVRDGYAVLVLLVTLFSLVLTHPMDKHYAEGPGNFLPAPKSNW